MPDTNNMEDSWPLIDGVIEQQFENIGGSIAIDVIKLSADFDFDFGNVQITFCPEYLDEILSHLKRLERNIRELSFTSTQLSARPQLISLLLAATEKYNLKRTTLHLAVYLMDAYMDLHYVPSTWLDLFAIVCLVVAAKFEEREDYVPKLVELNTLLNKKYKLFVLRRIEYLITRHFKWRLSVPTAATFAEYFIFMSITEEDIKINFTNTNEGTAQLYKNLLSSTNKLMDQLLYLGIRILRLGRPRPSLMASACIAAARKIQNITPMWPSHLEYFTGYNMERLKEYVTALISLHENNFNSALHHTMYSGIQTESDEPAEDIPALKSVRLAN